jgi:hypothetical protein
LVDFGEGGIEMLMFRLRFRLMLRLEMKMLFTCCFFAECSSIKDTLSSLRPYGWLFLEEMPEQGLP